MRKLYLFVLLISSSWNFAQPLKIKNGDGGIWSAGMRSTISLFNDSETDNFGTGLGGQMRLQLSKRLNTDWFFDYLTSDIKQVGHRTDFHIGWSVVYYPWLQENQLIKPFFLAGHCFDYSKMTENANRLNFDERWSSAVQAGIGTHFRLTDRLDFTLLGQYMIHLGNHIHPSIVGNSLTFSEEHGASLEGHLLITFGVNFKLFDLW
ncbi:MAG: hypothetical protein RL264_1975 [Bacteroidota bacterium]|jgi:hypothetical protein